MCKKGEKRESEGVSVLVFFFWRESCVQHSSSEEFRRIFWPYQKKKKNPDTPEAVMQLFPTSCSFFCGKRSPCF